MTKTMLTRVAFEASRRFMDSTARPLEIARFHHVFDDASVAPVFDALKLYQNADGGFGHALEPDLRANESSVLCTSIAFQVLRSINAAPDQELVSAGIAYLQETLDHENYHWRIIPSSAEFSPHAPWWNQAGREKEFGSFSLNPTAEILGYLFDYLGESHHDVLSLVSEQVITQLLNLDKIEMHELLCCLRLLKTKTLPGKVDRPVRQKLLQLIDEIISYDPAQWKEYGLRPLQVVDDPESPFISGRETSIAANLEYEISSQNEDGSWTPTWSWGDAFPNDWLLAYREWSGVLTLDKLLLLKRFGRIEGII